MDGQEELGGSGTDNERGVEEGPIKVEEGNWGMIYEIYSDDSMKVRDPNGPQADRFESTRNLDRYSSVESSFKGENECEIRVELKAPKTRKLLPDQKRVVVKVGQPGAAERAIRAESPKDTAVEALYVSGKVSEIRVSPEESKDPTTTARDESIRAGLQSPEEFIKDFINYGMTIPDNDTTTMLSSLNKHGMMDPEQLTDEGSRVLYQELYPLVFGHLEEGDRKKVDSILRKTGLDIKIYEKYTSTGLENGDNDAKEAFMKKMLFEEMQDWRDASEYSEGLVLDLFSNKGFRMRRESQKRTRLHTRTYTRTDRELIGDPQTVRFGDEIELSVGGVKISKVDGQIQIENNLTSTDGWSAGLPIRIDEKAVIESAESQKPASHLRDLVIVAFSKDNRGEDSETEA